MHSVLRTCAALLATVLATAAASLGDEPQAARPLPAIEARSEPDSSASGQVDAPAPAAGCCKVCTRGKACGNSCIARYENCHQPPGCACNG
jgi:hypothetical protein